MKAASRPWPLLLAVVSLGPGACRSRPDPARLGEAAPTPTSASSKPLDRLAPGELSAGNAEVWGFVVPREMRVEHRYADVAHLVGPVDPGALAAYVRDQVVVSHVEMGAARTTFPRAHIKGGAADRLYELEIVPEPGKVRLLIRDVTPPVVVPGLSDAERWRRAGLTPEGRPLDPKSFE